jgi:hypothetical protein
MHISKTAIANIPDARPPTLSLLTFTYYLCYTKIIIQDISIPNSPLLLDVIETTSHGSILTLDPIRSRGWKDLLR